MVYFLTVVRSLLAHIFLVFWTAVLSVAVVFFGSLKGHDQVTFIMALWCRGILLAYGVRVYHEGLEKLPAKGGAILLFNHQSHFDIPAVTAFSGRRLRYGAKIELFSVPFFGMAIRAAGCLPIARNNGKEVIRIYEKARVRFKKEDVIFALAPEGTRQAEPKIGTFKKGPFVFSLQSGVPVVPVIIEGADRVLPKGYWLVNLGRFCRTIRIKTLDPVYPVPIDGLSEEDFSKVLNQMVESCRDVFTSEFSKLQLLAKKDSI